MELDRVVFFHPSYFLSMYYVDDLSVALSATQTACVIGDTVFYADDLCIMSASLAGLHKFIDIYMYYNYSVQNSLLTFNTIKSVCVVLSLRCIVLLWF